ncbi:aconitase family-domain-containing protein [Leucosporidium creatinivorum]|uniref:Aconitate hydratase, mitochondrial n=1 Tax=Leucosporidium creatinivorum TaxID=106004 RepID=A0A1Y2EIY2_9BASI|nr:aconitase family-domain-containing protein [Leucosporidium creatinivorum]
MSLLARSLPPRASAVRSAAPLRSLATHARAVPPKNYPSITPPYQHLLKQLELTRSILNRPLTLAEKIIYSHLDNVEEGLAGGDPVRGAKHLKLRPDRVAMQDASAQMALLQFSTCDRPTTAVPTSIHCDHLISAYSGAEADLKRAIVSNKEVFDFLESAAKKYGIEFWGPGSGIIHQIVLENYSAPGLLMLGTDSHTPNAGGLGAIAIGVGGADAVDAMTHTPWELTAPKMIGVELKGKLSGWVSAKDVVLEVVGRLTVRGGTGHVIEYFGEGVETQSATGLATIANMGAEMGATTTTFPYTAAMRSYLHATNRGPVADAADKAQASGFLSADKGAEYDQHIVIDLSTLEPRFNGPFTPDFSTPLSKFGDLVKEKGWKDEISASLIGSCTNSSYHDMSRVASIARQAKAKGLKTATSFMITPGSELINATIERDGLKGDLEAVGGVVLSNACGPCIGQWDREECKGEENAILTSFNRNFKARNDGNRQTMNFLASPDIVTAMAFSGKLSFDPTKDELIGADGKPFRFEPPTGDELPSTGFTAGDTSYLPTALPTPVPETELAISPTSTRLELLAPFDPHFTAEEFADPNKALEFEDLRCLIRIRGKCTTDEISAAGAWLKYKGHLTNLSENTLIGATNDQNGKINSAIDYLPGESEGTIPEVAKRFKARGQPWMIVTDHNYGEGSAREHASLQPRFLGAKVILARSFARIHRMNLTKQGVLPLTLVNEDDYSLIDAGDKVSTKGFDALLRGDLNAEISVVVEKPDGKKVEIPTHHGLSKDQVEWIKFGSALNGIKAQTKATSA